MRIKPILIILLLITTACTAGNIPNETETPDDSQTPTKEDIMTEARYIKSNLARETFPQVDPADVDTIAQNNTEFALSFYEQIKQGDDNIIFSPMSLSLALSMTLAGAETSTEQAMLESLRFTMSEDKIHPAFNALLLAIEESQQEIPEYSEGSNFQLNIANSIWGQIGYDFKPDFLDSLARHYGAGVYNVDYINAPEASRQAINDWIEQETEEKIQDLIPPGAIDTLTRLVLANAIYFNGSWQYPFDESATAQDSFTLLDSSEKMVAMMKLSGEHLPYAQGEAFQAVMLPYLSPDFAMTIIVPADGSFKDFEANLSSETLKTIQNNWGYEAVNLKMPKFDFTTTTNAKDPLKAMGMSDAFDANSADFSGITEAEELFISDVLHKATITVDEEGTEAAAATAVIVAATSAMPGEPISLVIDRPFMFLIQHQPTSAILFVGRVTQP